MKKSIFSFVPFLCLTLISCSENKYRKVSELNNFKIVYNQGSLFNEDTVADELLKSIINKTSFQNIIIDELEENISYNQDQIYLTIDENLNDNTYKISRNKNSFVLTSDSNTGLIEASREFLNKIILSNSEDNLNGWYETAKTASYEAKEKLKVMSYNVRVANDNPNALGEDCSRSKRAPRILKKINQYQPDSFGVQEYSENWKELLYPSLSSQYGYIGYGRESTLKGESSGIFYNKDKLSLLESGTKWFSETPDVPGTKWDNAGNYNRIFTYGVFERHSDDFQYLHINTHFDLETAPRVRSSELLNSFIQQYKDKLPIIITGDFNNDKHENDAVKHMIDDFGYTDSFVEDKKAVKIDTYPAEGYYKEGIFTPNAGDIVSHVIDYCLQANEGFICDKYLVDTEKVSGDGIEAPAHTSDHYPVYCELTPYDPLDEFNPLNYDKEYAVTNNSFIDYDRLFNFLDTKSNKTNHDTYLAIDAAHNGAVKGTSKSLTKYECVGNLSQNGGYIEYKINSNKNQKADLVMVMAASLSGIKASGANARVVGLNNFNTLSLNNRNVDISKVNLRNDDVSAWYEWEQVVIKNVDLVEGENILRMEAKAYSNGKYYCPNQLLLEVFY